MMATFVGYKKCLDQDGEATDPKSVFYPLEIQQAQTCTKFDTRFNDVGFEISEYQVQLESGVFKRLKDKRLYN